MNKTIYYVIKTTSNGPQLFTTAKDFWDKHHYMDDGSDIDYKHMCESLNILGCGSLGSSIFEFNITEEQLITGMSSYGYTMQPNNEFVSFILR